MRPAQFAIDFLEGKTFQGYSQDEYWNGFACPYFSFEQAQQVAEAWRASGSDARYDGEVDAFSFEVNTGEGAKEYESYSGLLIEGMKLYPIGSSNWIWESVEE